MLIVKIDDLNQINHYFIHILYELKKNLVFFNIKGKIFSIAIIFSLISKRIFNFNIELNTTQAIIYHFEEHSNEYNN